MHDVPMPEWGWDDQAQSRFAAYYELLVDWNSRVNLTHITQRREVYVKHFYDSVWIRSRPEWQRLVVSGSRVVDVGTGAGFPGMALAILEPDKQFVLVDALQKRVAFLNAVVASLGLENVEVVHARAEDAAHLKQWRERFDLVVARAVARLNVLLEYTLPFARVGGAVFAYKGPGVDEELPDGKFAAKRLGGEVADTLQWQLPDELGERTLVVIDKVASTQREYPRKAGTPQKQPLSDC